MEDSTPSMWHAQYRAMTAEHRAAWGRAELETRKRDLVNHGFAVADSTADARRLAIGASHRAATVMVCQAVRENRREEERRKREARMAPVLSPGQIHDLHRLGRVAVATEQSPKAPQYDRDLTAQQQGLANVGLLEGWK